MKPIETAETGYVHVPGCSVAERCLASHWPRGVARFRPRELVAIPVAIAEVNHGRWIVRCPFCTSAQFASKTDHRFFCVDCLNDRGGRAWVSVLWPDVQTIVAIERALLARPEIDFMNWRSTMAVDALLAENRRGGWHHSWTTPRTWAVGEVVTAAIMNTHVRDDLNETLPARAVDAVLAARFFW